MKLFNGKVVSVEEISHINRGKLLIKTSRWEFRKLDDGQYLVTRRAKFKPIRIPDGKKLATA